ncbi:hypothetical protein FB107DRAFT_279131 [Schizophyllum commune]
MSTARNIPTAIPELDYGEPPRNKEPRRSRSRSLRSVANLVLGKQNTKPSPNEPNPPAPTPRWPSISALRRSQKTTLPPPSEVPSSAGDASANADLYTRDRRSADIPRRRFSLSRPIRLSLNLARPARRGASEVEFLESEVAEARQDMDAHGPARHGMDAYTHSHDLRRRLEELEVDGASTQVLAGDASSRAAGSVELSLLDGDGGEASPLEVDGEASSFEVDGGEASSLEVDSAEASPLAVDGVGPALLESDCVNPPLLEFDCVDPSLLGSDCVEPSLFEPDGADPSLFELDAEPGQVEDPSHDAADPSLVQARASLVNIDAAAHVDAAVLADDGQPVHATDDGKSVHATDGGKPGHVTDGGRPVHATDGGKPVHATDGGRPVHATDFEVDSEQVNSAKGQPTSPHVAPIAIPRVAPIASPRVAPIASPHVAPIPSPHVAFAEHVVEYEPGLLNLVHSCYEGGDASDAEVGGDDEDGYHGDEDGHLDTDADGFHDLDDGYHGDDELLYSSDDEDVYAYPPNAMFGVSSIASAAASNPILTPTVAYAPTYKAPSVLPANFPAVMPLNSRPVAVPLNSRPVAVPLNSRPVAIPFTSRAPVSIPFTSRAPAAILPPTIPRVSDDACDQHHTPQHDHHAPQYDQHHTPQYETHTPQYAAFFSESPSSYDVAMDFLPLSDLEGTLVDEVGATFDEAGATFDEVGATFDEAGVTFDEVGATFDEAGAMFDEAGAPVGEGASCEIVKGGQNAEDGDSEDLIFPDEALFPIDPVIYETKEGGRAWKEEDMPLWTGDVPLEPSLEASLETSLETPLMSMLETPLESSFDMPLEPSFDMPLEPSLDVPLDPLLQPLLKEERGVWRDDEAMPLPPLQMDRLPWLDGSDEAESPLSPMDGADSLLSPASFGAELPALMAESPPRNEKLAVDEDERFGNFPAGDNADFALFPTDPRSLPYLLRLSAEYDGTPASELNGSPFPSPLPRSPFDENVLSFADENALPFADASALPFASLSAQEIATGHQLVRRGRAGVVARKVVVEHRSSQVQGDMTAQVDGTTQIESAAQVESAARVGSTARVGSVVQVDPTVLVDIAASSPLDVFLPHVRSPASAPDLLDFFPAPLPFGDLADGMQFSQSRALVRRPTEGEMAVVRAEPSSNSLSSSTTEPSTFSTLLEDAYGSSSSTALPMDRPRRPTLTAMQSALLPRVEPFVLDVRDANGMVLPSQFINFDSAVNFENVAANGSCPSNGARSARTPALDLATSSQSAEVVSRFPANIVLHHPVAALALDTPQLATLYSPLDNAVSNSPSSLGAVHSPSYFASLRTPRSPLGMANPYSSTLGMTGSPFEFASLRSPLGSIATDVDPFELAVAVRAPREMAVVITDIAHEVNDGAVSVDEPALPFTAFLPDDYPPDDVDDEPLPFPGLPSWELAVQMQAHYIEPKLPRALEAMLGGDASLERVQVSTIVKSSTYTLPSVPSTLESMVLGTAKASLVSVQPRSLVSSLVGLGSGATTVASTSEGTNDLAEKLAVDGRDIVFIDAESEDSLAPSASAAQDRASADDNVGKMQQALRKTAAPPLGELPLPDMDFASTMVSAVEGLWNGA